MKNSQEQWHILYIDDDEDDYHLTREMLAEAQGRKISLDWASTYPSGFEKLSTNHYDAVLVDYDLDAETGIDLIREFTRQGYKAPLILYTGRGSFEVDLEAMQAGATMYLTKGELNSLLLERSIRYAIEHKQVEQALHESEEREREKAADLEAIMNTVPAMIWISHDPQCRNMIGNRYGYHFLRMGEKDNISKTASKEKLFQQPYKNFKNGKEIPPEELPMQVAAATGKPALGYEFDLVFQDGAVRTVFGNVMPLLNKVGAPSGAVAAFIDITERKRAEEALRDAHERAVWMARFPEENHNPVARASMDGRVLFCNSTAANLPGWDCKSGQGLTDPLLTLVQHALTQGQEVRQDVQLGKNFYSISVMPFPQESYANIYGLDITHHKLAEKALQKSQESLNDILESIRDGFFALDKEWRYTYVNQRAVQIAELTSDQMIGKTIWELFPFLKDTPAEKYYHQAMEERMPVQFITRGYKTGRIYDIHVYPSQEGISVFYVDISDQTKAEQALRENRERLKLALQVANMVTWEWNYQEDQLTITENASDVPELQNFLSRAEDGYQMILPEDRILAADAIRRSLETNEAFHFEAQAVLAPEEMVRWISVQGRTMRGPEEKPPLLFGVVQDITERKQAEQALQDYAKQLEQSNHALQEFAFIASHDLQEPLRKVKAFGDLLKNNYALRLDAQGRDYIERMQQASNRMQAMVEGLLQYSRVATQGQPFALINLNQIAAVVLSDLEVRISQTKGSIELSPLPSLEADPIQMRQLFQNLIGNALKYQREGVPPIIKMTSNSISEDEVEIKVEDNGIGFDMRQADRIFEPFVRLESRAKYEGTGMGLAICQKIVERHRGSISVASKPGEGSVFTVTLPTRQKQP